MILLDDESLERSPVVANMRMNRERGAVGVNSYEKELGIDPISLLVDHFQTADSTSWLDLCCGRGRALIDAAVELHNRSLDQSVSLMGVDLVDMFDDIPPHSAFLKLESASLHQWEATQKYELITCVHGLHYVGDKLALIERASQWLTDDGLFLASLDLANLRLADGKPLARRIGKRFRECGVEYNSRRHLLSCVGAIHYHWVINSSAQTTVQCELQWPRGCGFLLRTTRLKGTAVMRSHLRVRGAIASTQYFA